MFSSTTLTAALGAALLLKTTSAAPSPDRYQLVTSYAGNSFFDGWTFWDQEDPTHGFVNYTNQQNAIDAKLAGYNFYEATSEHTAYLGVDSETVNPAAGRASVRISSEQTWNSGGLFVADVRHSPEIACGAWPALWLVGPEWPHGGEIDIIEYVNVDSYNSMTLHTGPNCKSSVPKNLFLGKQVATDCDVDTNPDDNTGCSIRGAHAQSFDPKSKKAVTHPASGPGFNEQGGGVYATLWNAEGIKIWMFPHTALPADLVAGKPDPASWRNIKPVAQFGGEGCDYSQSFTNQQLIVDTTFCGDWAGKVWSDTPQCAAKAPTCEEFVGSNPGAFKKAFWEIASIKVYQTGEQQQASGTKAIAKADSNGKRAASSSEWPARLGEILPAPQEVTAGDDLPKEPKEMEQDADCMHEAYTVEVIETVTVFAATAAATAPSASASAAIGGYSNSTNFAGLRRTGRGMVRLFQ